MSENNSRRDVLKKSGITIAATVGVAGCTGDSSDGGNGNGNGGGSDGGNGNGNGNGGGSDSDPEEQFPEWDPENPEWPQPITRLYEEDYEFGTEAALESMETRDEPFHGESPLETPDNEDELLDPDTLTFSIAPDESASVYEDAFSELINNMEEETGKTVDFQSVNSKAAMVETMRSERLHVAGFSTGNTAFAVNLAGAQPFGMMLQDDGTFGYKLFVVARKDNEEINELMDLEGRTIPHTSESSNSGNQAPTALFAEQGLVAGEDYEVTFSGGHEQSVLGIINGDYPAGPTCSGCPKRFANQDLLDVEELKVVWASDPFPTRGFCYHYKLHPDIKDGIERAHFDYDYSGTGMDTELDLGTKFAQLDYETHWHTILVIQEANGVSYDDGL